MTPDSTTVSQLDTVVICHREPLIAAATAALIEDRGVARHAAVVNSVGHLLSRLGHTVDVAVVFDSIGEDLSDLFEAMHHRGLTTPIVVVSTSADAQYAATVIEAGAAGVVYAWCGPEELHESILDARRGQVVIPNTGRAGILEALRTRRVQRRDARRTLAHLTALDVRILRSLCDGMTVTRIAERLLLSPHTVRGRVRAIGSEIGARGQLGIAAAGRHLLTAARLPIGADVTPMAVMRSGADRDHVGRLR